MNRLYFKDENGEFIAFPITEIKAHTIVKNQEQLKREIRQALRINVHGAVLAVVN